MAEHTPRPWQVIPEAEAQSRWIVGDAAGGSIADCEPPGPWMSRTEADANARLIAAAPDLLAAIINSDDAHWTPAMRAAIAKATGES